MALARSDASSPDLPGRMRIDKWLWQTRFTKTRGLATELVAGGKVRLNGQRIDKPSREVCAGDVLTVPQGDRIRVVRVAGMPDRRGPAIEAQALYEDL